MIIVTGGSGKVGRACVKDLMEHGYKVASIDMARPAGLSNPPKPTDVTFTRVDITDFGAGDGGVLGDQRARRGARSTGIVHLGAIASPGEAPDHVIFEVNMISTYNVFEAARRLGIRNVVWASSETVYGIPYAGGPAYVPVDEEIELPQWSYSLTQADGREAGRAIRRWDKETKIIGLRFSNVQEPQDYANFAELPGTRARGISTSGPISMRAMRRRRSACRSNAKLKGAHVFGIANTNSVMTQHNDELLDEVFPGTKRKRPLKPNESLISIEKAQRVLGYKPEYDWKG